MSSVKIIDFYDNKLPYFEFSNYYISDVVIDRITYKSVEHYYQSRKFTEQWYVDSILAQSTPNKAKILASQRIAGGYNWRIELNHIIQKSLDANVKIVPNWEEIKDNVMWVGLYHKFNNNTALKTMLTNTGDAILRESSPRDSYWGIGPDQKGTNKLGLLLMILRKHFVEVGNKS